MRKKPNLEATVAEILDQLYVTYEHDVPIGKYRVDFLVGTKIIECNGDYWHCNPVKYSPDYYHKARKRLAKSIWVKDDHRRNTLIEEGYSALILWEEDIRLHTREVRQQIKRFLKG